MAAATPAAAPVARARVCPGHARAISELHYSEPTADGVFVISGCIDKKPMLRDGVTGDWIGTFEGHKGAVWGAKLNATATHAITGSADFSAKLWSAESGDEVRHWVHPYVVKAVDINRDASMIVTGTAGKDRKVRFFETKGESDEPVKVLEHESGVRKVLYTKNEKQLITGCEDGSVNVWDIESSKIVKSVKLTGAVMDMELSRDGKTLTVASGKQVTFFDASTYELRMAHTLPIEVEAASLHPKDSSKFVAGGSDAWVRVFDCASGAELVCHKGHHGSVHCMRFAPDGESYASGADDGTIRIWRYEPAAEAAASPADGGGGGGGGAAAE